MAYSNRLLTSLLAVLSRMTHSLLAFKQIFADSRGTGIACTVPCSLAICLSHDSITPPFLPSLTQLCLSSLFPAAASGSQFHFSHETFLLAAPSTSLSLPNKSESSVFLSIKSLFLSVLLSREPEFPFYLVNPHLLILATLF